MTDTKQTGPGLHKGKVNDYNEKPKETVVHTPAGVARYIFEKVEARKLTRKVFDIGSAEGDLSRYFYEDGNQVYGIDNRAVESKYLTEFRRADFFLSEKQDLQSWGKPDLVLSNPPWNNPDRLFGRALIPEMVTRKVFDLWGKDVSFALITSVNYLFNVECKSKRLHWLREQHITGLTVLPRDIFPGVNSWCCIAWFNLPGIGFDALPLRFCPDAEVAESMFRDVI